MRGTNVDIYHTRRSLGRGRGGWGGVTSPEPIGQTIISVKLVEGGTSGVQERKTVMTSDPSLSEVPPLLSPSHPTLDVTHSEYPTLPVTTRFFWIFFTDTFPVPSESEFGHPDSRWS